MQNEQKQTAAFVLAAPKSGSGKTIITCALLAALKARGCSVRAFKSGPDYIDPMFHEQVIGVPSRNLDTFFSGEEQIRALYAREQEPYAYTVIEGAMGLYDGLGGTQEEGSAYHLARTLDLPVVLVLDARGMGRTMVALLAGLLAYDRDHRIIGVILNRTSAAFLDTIAPVIEEELGLLVFGCFPVQKDLHLESRHLGLKLPGEITALQAQVEAAAAVLEEHVDVTRLLGQAKSWQRLHAFSTETYGRREGQPKRKAEVTIAVAKDPAFCFYYVDNLRLLEESGAKLVFFSPLRDTQLPQEADALLLGGGYPELCAKELSENTLMRAAIRAAIADGMPSVAECGGFMYLHETLTDLNGQTYPMVGAVKGNCHNNGKLTRFGYITVRENVPHFLDGGTIKAHEFHYYDSDENGDCCVAEKPVRGTSWACIHADAHHWWGYPHLYYPSGPKFVENWILAAERYHRKRQEQQTENARQL